jgi:hypothetical protein
MSRLIHKYSHYILPRVEIIKKELASRISLLRLAYELLTLDLLFLKLMTLGATRAAFEVLRGAILFWYCSFCYRSLENKA